MKQARNKGVADSKRPKVVWVIRAGKNGEAHDQFLRDGVIALADAGLGDLKKHSMTRESICTRYRMAHPKESMRGSAGSSGKFYRFSNEMQIGDLVLYPASKLRRVYIAEVVGEYEFASERRAELPHRRKVRWIGSVDSSVFSIFARREMGAARTFFSVKTNVKELNQILEQREFEPVRQ